jgi:hypothetical protein
VNVLWITQSLSIDQRLEMIHPQEFLNENEVSKDAFRMKSEHKVFGTAPQFNKGGIQLGEAIFAAAPLAKNFSPLYDLLMRVLRHTRFSWAFTERRPAKRVFTM